MHLGGGRARTGMPAVWGQNLMSSDLTSPVAQALQVSEYQFPSFPEFLNVLDSFMNLLKAVYLSF